MPNEFCRSHELVPLAQATYEFLHVVPRGVGLKQVMHPDYWRAAASLLEAKKFATIDLVCDDNTWEARVRVIGVADGIVRLRVLYTHEHKASGQKAPPGYVVEHMPTVGWRALDPNGSIVCTGEALEDDAIRNAIVHAAAVSARRAA